MLDNSIMTNSYDKTITMNRKAKHDYSVEDQYEAGLLLLGWEVKSCRNKTVQLKESHITIRRGEAFLVNAHFSVPSTTSTHSKAAPIRPRKLLLHRRQIDQLIGLVQQKGFTLVPFSMYWKDNRVKINVALAKGKKLHDKRATIKEREWKRTQSREMKKNHGNS